MKLLVVKETMFLKSHEPFRDVELVIIYTTYIAGRGGGGGSGDKLLAG